MKNTTLAILFLLLVFATAPVVTTAEEEDGGAAVGPDKAILTADEHAGIKLSPEAIRNLGITSRKITGKGPWSVPVGSELLSGEEVNVYRLRDGFYKRIDLTEHTPAPGSQMKITSEDLRDGDEIVITGVPLLRLAELAAFGGSESHSH